MAKYYFTEFEAYFPELECEQFNHMETSHWLRASKDSREPGWFMSQNFEKYIRDGLMVNHMTVKNGLLNAKHLWKEQAWHSYLQELNSFDDFDEFRARCGWALGMNPRVTSYCYKQVDEEEKMELIKLHFMDYFVD